MKEKYTAEEIEVLREKVIQKYSDDPGWNMASAIDIFCAERCSDESIIRTAQRMGIA